MKKNPAYIIGQLKANRATFKSLISDIPPKAVTWKPSKSKWCALEVLCHLHDEEKDDFRMRVMNTLEDPAKPHPPVNPLAWVKEHKYMKQDFYEVAGMFLKERTRSVRLLNELKRPQWDNAYVHPKFGEMTAFFFLSNWLAHDYLHIKQLTRLKYDYLRATSGQPLVYAGKWT